MLFRALRSRLLKPLEKEAHRVEETIKKTESIAVDLEQKLIVASEQNDGDAITSLAKELDENKKKTEQLYDSWEMTTASIQEVQSKYPLD